MSLNTRKCTFWHVRPTKTQISLPIRAVSPVFVDRITKTRLYNFDSLKPHFYTVRLGFTGVYIIFFFLLENIDCGTRLNRLAEAVLTSTTIYVLSRNMKKNISFFFLSEKIQFLEVKFSIYLNRGVFCNGMKKLCILCCPKMHRGKIVTRMRECADCAQSWLDAHVRRNVFWLHSYFQNVLTTEFWVWLNVKRE